MVVSVHQTQTLHRRRRIRRTEILAYPRRSSLPRFLLLHPRYSKGSGPGLPVPLAIAVALCTPFRALLAVAGAGESPSTSSSISRWAAKPIISRRRSVSGLLHEVRRFIISSVIGGSSNQVGVQQPDPTDELSMTTREAARSLQRYGAALRERLHSSPSYTTLRDTTPSKYSRQLGSGAKPMHLRQEHR